VRGSVRAVPGRISHKLSALGDLGWYGACSCGGAMKPYSRDLRQRVVDAYEALEGSVREVAQRFKVDPKTVQNYLNLKRKTGSVAPRPHRGGPQPKLDEGGVQQVRTVVEEKNDRTHAEIAEELKTRIGVKVSRATVWRALERLRITRKKNAARGRAR
jgi:transposase